MNIFIYNGPNKAFNKYKSLKKILAKDMMVQNK